MTARIAQEMVLLGMINELVRPIAGGIVARMEKALAFVWYVLSRRAQRLVIVRDAVGSYDQKGDFLSRRNFVLLKAVRSYLASLGLGATMHAAEVDFVAAAERKMVRDSYVNDTYGSTAAHLARYRAQIVPMNGVAVPVAIPGGSENVTVTFDERTEAAKPGSYGATQVTSCLVEARTPQACDAFLARAIEHYKALVANTGDGKRYMFVPRIAGAGADKTPPPPLVFDRYELSDEIDFECVFFPEKPELVARLDEFALRAGKYTIKGVRHRLGVMLHGPPGTGKTSTIKAIAHKLGRHIVSVPLSKIATNEELMHVMHTREITVAGDASGELFPLSFANAVYVMEDIDCTSADPAVVSVRSDLPVSQSTTTALDVALAAVQPANPRPRIDALDLSGLLNCIDGAVDTPGRVLVMTSNFPEKLDPALVRDGRIDLRIKLGRAAPADAARLARRFWAEAAESDFDFAAAKTPAEIEGLALRAETYADFLEKMG